SERVNSINDTYNVDITCRNADYGLIRLTLANIAHHASIRYGESHQLKTPYIHLIDLLKKDAPAVAKEIANTS
ncbi:MAG: hypothetical protein GY847_42130, partial [Proteobacteria bacterium]|nr:hypothetical protein [Pseudomonadota bacterium]